MARHDKVRGTQYLSLDRRGRGSGDTPGFGPGFGGSGDTILIS